MKIKYSELLLLLLFFISGTCGLVYQVVWARMFGLVFGNTLYASSTVLTVFMAGLALGSYFAGRYLSNRSDGLRLYAVMEIFIGIFGILMPFILQLLSSGYLRIYHGFHPSFEVLTIIRYIFSFSALVIPCTFMGATLPVLSRFVSERGKGNPDRTGKLYGINALGAVTGCFLAGFYLIPAVGISGTTFIAALANIIAGSAAFLMYAGTVENGRAPKSDKSDSPKTTPSPCAGNLLIASYALSGFAALALEITWLKALSWVFQMIWSFQMDSYAFAAMLSVLLAGIGCGSLTVSLIINKIKNINRFLYATQFLLGVFVIVTIFIIQNALYFREMIFSIVNSPLLLGFHLYLAGFLGTQALMQLLLAIIMLFIPSVLMGIAFPLFTRAYFLLTGNIGKSVGSIYSANTIGGIAGSLAAGFFLIPAIGLLPTLALLAGCYFLTALAVLATAKEGRIAGWTAAACIFTGTVFLLRSSDFDYSHFIASTLPPSSVYGENQVVYFKEHAAGAILVRESSLRGKEMFSDGTIVASDANPNLYSHVFPAHLVSLLLKGSCDIMVIGFGSGITSGSMLQYYEVASLEAIEINRGIIEPAEKYFSKANNNILSNKKLHLVFQDGKNYVKMSEKSYDAIYSSPSLPQANQGSAGLFTKEFFSDCRKRLKKGGFQCLWVPLHMYRPEEFLTIVKTFQSVYPHATLWHPYQNELSIGLAYLIGSDESLNPDYRQIAEKMERPQIRKDIARLGDGSFQTPEEFVSIFSMGESALKRITDTIETVNSDEHPVVEYYKRTGDMMQSAIMSKLQLVELLGKNSEDPFSYVRNVPENQVDTVKNILARMYTGKQYLMMGHAMLAYKGFLSATGNCPPEIDEKMCQYYSLANGFIPENLYLRGFLGRQ